MNDEILERWNDISLKDRLEMLNKFNIHTLQGVIENKNLQNYLKENHTKSKLIRRPL